jgi:hypothetical protein
MKLYAFVSSVPPQVFCISISWNKIEAIPPKKCAMEAFSINVVKYFPVMIGAVITIPIISLVPFVKTQILEI